MRSLILALALLAAACAEVPAQQPTQPLAAAAPTGARGIYGYGTLSSSTLEAELAPLYTRNALLRQSAARRLQDGRITLAAAKQVQANADQARTLLDRARHEEIRSRAPLIAQASALQDEAARTLEGGNP